MPFSYKEFFFGGTTFCCCLPVRIGVIIMSLLTILFSGLLSVILWYEVSSTHDMTSGERAAFIVAGLFQTLLFVASILGFAGAIARKQLFVVIYAYIIYVHFVLNIAVAAFLLWKITRGVSTAAVKVCQDSIQNQDAKAQCTGLLRVATDVYFVVAAIVLLVEMYGAVIVARYVNQLKSQKRKARASRMMGSESGFQLVPRGLHYSTLPDGQDTGLLYSPYTPQTTREFDPYEEVTVPSYGTGPSYAYDGVPPPTADVDVGYGGESSMYEDISAEEKGRLRQGDNETGISEVEWQANEEEERRRDSRSPAGPPPAHKREIDELPRYTLSDPPVNRAALVDNSGA